MKLTQFFFLITLTILTASCQTDSTEEKTTINRNSNNIPKEVITKFKEAGFITNGIRKFQNGYLVENDLYFENSQLSEILDDKVKKQFKSNNIVSGIRTIKVFVANDFDRNTRQAVDEALRRYNILNLRLKFERTTNINLANIKITAFFELPQQNGTTLGLAGFPRNGNPHPNIALNTFVYNENTTTNNIVHVITHEIGHAIGFRHTDYANISFSCGGEAINEGPRSVGAIHIPGTPIEPTLDSWMLACTNNDEDRNFIASDIVALDALYSLNRYPESWNSNYVEKNGWRVNRNPRIMADVNGDGKADIVGFGDNDVMVALSNGSSFNTPISWKKTMTYADGWRVNKNPRSVADVNGDGKADLIGFGNNEVLVALSTGSSFQKAKSWKKTMTYNDGWQVDKNPRIIADVNGDGKADIIGFGNNDVLIALSDGNKFKTAKSWTKNFTYSDGWRTDNHTRTVADVNGDGKADIIGFGTNDVLVALSNGNGLETTKSWKKNFTYSAGWKNDKNPRGIADVNGDGKADIIGFGNNDVLISLSNGSSFQDNKLWVNDFGYDAGGWRIDKNPRRIADVNGDGKADIIGFSNNDVLVSKSDF